MSLGRLRRNTQLSNLPAPALCEGLRLRTIEQLSVGYKVKEVNKMTTFWEKYKAEVKKNITQEFGDSPLTVEPPVDKYAGLSFEQRYELQKKNSVSTFLLTLFFGAVGLHKFYLKDGAAGSVYLLFWFLGWLTLGLSWIPLAVIVLIDLFNADGATSNFNTNLMRDIQITLAAEKAKEVK